MRVVCFGAGWVTVHRHVPAMRATGRFDVVGIVDVDGERAAAAARLLGVPQHAEASTPRDLRFLDQVDAVVCGVPPRSHHQVVRAALEAGKHVLCEKPLAMTVKEAEELLALANRGRRKLAVVHNFQFMRSAQAVADWISRGRLGSVGAIVAVQLSSPGRRLPTWHDDLPLGLFYDESPHMLYLVRAFSGMRDLELSAVRICPSASGNRRTPRHLDVQLSAEGMPINLIMHFESAVSEWHITVVGEQGVAILDLFRDIATFLPSDGAHKTRGVLRTSLAATAAHWGGYLRSGPGHVAGGLLYGNDVVFTRFADAVTSGGELEGIASADGLAVVRLQQAISGSHRTSALT